MQRCPVTPIITLLLANMTTIACAQSRPQDPTPSLSLGDVSLVTPPHPQTRLEVVSRLGRTVNVSWNNASLADIFTQIEENSGLTIIPMWLDDEFATSTRAQPVVQPAKATSTNTAGTKDAALPPIERRIGLRRDTRITLRAESVTLQHALELALVKADVYGTGSTLGSTWQLGAANTLQVGPRERLDRFVRVDSYDVADLVQIIRDFRYEGPKFVREAPASGFPSNAGLEDTRTHDKRGEALRQLIMDTCEPASWIELGGASATIRYDIGSKMMVVRAPDYVHRAIDGYRWDPAAPADIGEPMPTPPAPERPRAPVPAGS